jgi:4-diphosphocytidyl-2-C-methyl-D-erythritol kinase
MTLATDRLAPVVRLAPAKVNLTLAVVGRRSDGYHALHSVMAPLELADRLAVSPVAPPRAGEAAADALHVTGFDPGPPESNLVLRAFAAARALVRPTWPGAPAPPPPLVARLDKRVPVAAGLGGGSSDAAAAILAALEAWGAELATAERTRLAANLGSDVPFFLADGIALVEGRGERVERLAGVRAAEPPGVLLVTPSVAVSTAAVFAAYDAGAGATDRSSRVTSGHLAEELATGTLGAAELVARAGVLATANDLTSATAAVDPRLPRFRRALARVLGRPVGQSGSGPTVWALYPSLDGARAAAATVEAALREGTLVAPEAGPAAVVATRFAHTALVRPAAGRAQPEEVHG